MFWFFFCLNTSGLLFYRIHLLNTSLAKCSWPIGWVTVSISDIWMALVESDLWQCRWPWDHISFSALLCLVNQRLLSRDSRCFASFWCATHEALSSLLYDQICSEAASICQQFCAQRMPPVVVKNKFLYDWLIVFVENILDVKNSVCVCV